MKNLIVIIIAVFLLVPMTTISAQKKKNKKSKKEQTDKKQVKNLDYTVHIGNEAGSELNFYAEYFVPLKGTDYEDEMYKTKDGKFFFRDEAIHVIDPVKDEVKEITSDNLYKLVRLINRETNTIIRRIELSEIFVAISAGTETREGIYRYSDIDYNLQEVIFGQDTMFVTPIDSSIYNNCVGIDLEREFCYIMIPKNKSEILIKESGELAFVKAPEIYVMKRTNALLPSDKLFRFKKAVEAK